jgi:hypothetical protein
MKIMQIIFESLKKSEIEEIETTLHNAGIHQTEQYWYLDKSFDVWKVKHRMTLCHICCEGVTRAIELWSDQNPEFPFLRIKN